MQASGSLTGELTTGDCGADFAARKGKRLKDALVAERWLLVEFFPFTCVAQLLPILARSPMVVHSWSSQSKNGADSSPSFDKSKGSVLQGKVACQYHEGVIRKSESACSIK